MAVLLTTFGENTGVRLLAGVLFFGLLAWLFYSAGRGSGKTVYVLTALVFGAAFYFSPIFQLVSFFLLLALIVWNERLQAARRRNYLSAQARFEGGGIKRGFTPPEAAVLLGKPFNITLTLLLFGMLRKGFLRQVGDAPLHVEIVPEMRTRERSLNPQKRADLRRQGAQELNMVLHPFEEPFLELLETESGKPLREVDFGITVKPFVEDVARRLGGFDLGETQEYYRLIIQRAPKEARSDGVLVKDRQKVFDRNFEWILLQEGFAAILDGADFSYAPKWLRNEQGEASQLAGTKTFAEWAAGVMEEMKYAISPEDLEVKLGKSLDGVSATLMSEIARATYYG